MSDMSDMSEMSEMKEMKEISNTIICHTLPPLLKATIIKRPSKSIRSPYVADIVLEDGTEALGHAPSLGCCGLVEAGSSVFVYDIHEECKKQGKPANTKCRYRIVLSSIYDERLKEVDYVEYLSSNIIVGVAPKMAEKMVSSLLTQNALPFLDIEDFKAEVKMGSGNSRFDFVGYEKDNTKFIVEVKNVPLADFEDIGSKERKKKNYKDVELYQWKKKVAYFPDGYRKKANAPVSERAIKHLDHIREIICEAKTQPSTVQTRGIMLYVVQRNDATLFQPSVIDQFYRDAYIKALRAGVEAYAIHIEWIGNQAYYKGLMEINEYFTSERICVYDE